MKTQRTWPYLSLVALMGLASCSTSRQTAQNTGEMDDLYASSSNAVVYEAPSQVTQATQRAETPQAMTRQRDRYSRNTNPDYSTTDEQRGYTQNSDEYYTELSTRNVKRGLSADPGWNSTDAYNDGFTNGYYAGMGNPSYNSARWNPWGYGNSFGSGLSLGIGLGSAFGGYSPFYSPFGYNSWGYGGSYYSRFNDPFYGGYGSYAYNPWGFGGFGNPYGYGGFGSYGYNSYYGGGYYGGGYGGYGRPIIVNNTVINGADPYRNSNRTVGARGGSSATNRYNGDFNNTPRTTGNTGGRQASGSAPAYSNNTGSTNTGSTNSNASDGYYARPRQNSRGTYYYENGGSAPSGNTSRSSEPTSTYSNNSGNNSNGGYYSAPRQNSRGSYSAPSDNGGSYSNSNGGGNRGGYSQPSQPSYQAPQQQQRTYESRPSYQPQQQSQPSYSAPSSDGGSRGGGSYSAPSSSGSSSGGGGGGSRGPR
jgi:hypothetical protein